MFFKDIENSFVYEYNNADKKNTQIKYLCKIELPEPIKEGWGITNYNPETSLESLIISDGSDTLYYVNPDANMTTLEITKTIQASYNNFL